MLSTQPAAADSGIPREEVPAKKGACWVHACVCVPIAQFCRTQSPAQLTPPGTVALSRNTCPTTCVAWGDRKCDMGLVQGELYVFVDCPATWLARLRIWMLFWSGWDMQRMFTLQNTKRVSGFVSECMKMIDNRCFTEGNVRCNN